MTTRAAADAHAVSVRAKNRAISILLEPAKSRERPRTLLPGPCRHRELPDPDVSERHFVAVILQQDVAADLRAPPRFVLELARCLRRHERWALELVLDHLHAVQPVLDVFAVDDDAAGIDVACRLERLVRGRGNRVVERRGRAMRTDLR